MSNQYSTRAERAIAKRYEDRGYTVVSQPLESEIPFSLGSYKPDLLATKKGSMVLVEVKSRGTSSLDSRRLLQVKDEVEKHPGWQFVVVSVDTEELRKSETTAGETPSIEAIRGRLKSLDPLLANESVPAELLLPQLWVVYVSTLRAILKLDSIVADDLTDLSLLNKAYTEGVISLDESVTAKVLFQMRNEAVHRLNVMSTLQDCKQLRKLVQTHLDRLSAQEDL